MCDTLCALSDTGALFAKSSDRPIGEPQVFATHPRRPAGGALRTQYLELADRGAFAVAGSRPTWMWGFEHGVNEHGVAAGNEKVWTTEDPRQAPDALTGMDLVRLGLERGRTAERAVDAITDLLERHGQGGVCEEATGARYFSSFLVADPGEVWVLETMGPQWAARRSTSAGAAISNRISLRNDFTRAGPTVGPDDDIDRWRRASSPTAHADRRLALTAGAVEQGRIGEPHDAVALLRHHGQRTWGDPAAARRAPEAIDPVPAPASGPDGRGVTLCMHLRDDQATNAAMVATLPRDPDESIRVWSASGSPCCSVFVPTRPFVDGPIGGATDEDRWHRFDALRRRAEQERTALEAIRAVLGPLEHELWTADQAGRPTDLDDAFGVIDHALTRLGV